MEQNVVIQIITNHLNGKSLREIATELDISKDASANVIKDWKNGKINFLQLHGNFIFFRHKSICNTIINTYCRFLNLSNDIM